MAGKNYRDEIAEIFAAALEEDPIRFIKGWNSASGSPSNAMTNIKYKGINRLYLKHIENEKNFGDNRWMTFRQIKEKGYHLKQGSKGYKVEYYIPYDRANKKWITWEEYDKRNEIEDDYILKQKIYTVFNGSQIEGLEKIELRLNDINEDEVVERVSLGLGVPIIETYNSDRACYNVQKDEILIPLKGQFKSQVVYVSTVMHELGHSTGHESRLNRDIKNTFGTEAYAFEELVAEITSSFMGEYVNQPVTEELMNNHKAYIQSWAAAIKKDKNFLFKAVKEADRAADYMVEHAHLEDFLEEKEVHKQEVEEEFEM